MPGSLGEVSVDEADDKHNSSNTKKKKKKKNRKDERLEKEKQLLMPSSSKPRKRLNFRIRKKPISPMVSSSSSSSSGLLKACCFCGIKPPETKESTSPVSDPNDENFTHEMVRALLETDDFCSKDCNPHL